MKQQIAKFLIAILNPINKKLGFTRNGASSNELNKVDLLSTLFTNLKTIGFEPKLIIDIGANHGTWTRETLKYFPDAKYTLIEPQEWLKDSIKDLLETNKNITFIPCGAGKVPGTFKFTLVDRDDSCTFGISEEEAKQKGFEQIEIPVITLNDLVFNSPAPTIPDLVKIDAEGLDLEVLDGASELFGKTEVFMVEASVKNSFFDNSFLKMVNYMDSKGYTLYEITDLNRPFELQVLWLVELAFVKKGGIIDSFNVIENQ